MIVRNADFLYNGDGLLNLKLVKSCIMQHEADVRPRLEKLRGYYRNEAAILNRSRPGYKANNRMAHAYPRYISLIASGYLLGEPVQYSADTDIEPLTDAYTDTDTASVDAELARDASICGYGVELCYANEDAQPRTAALEPERAFVVYDDTVAAKPLFGCYYFDKTDIDGRKRGIIVHAYTETEHYTIDALGIAGIPEGAVTYEQHMFGGVPIVEYWNNEEEAGDFEYVISEVDAYNTLQSDRVNDKEQFVDSILLIRGAMLEDEVDESGEVVKTGMNKLRTERLLNLPDTDSDAAYLSNTMNAADTEVLKDAIANDIHKLSLVPDLTDRNFASNASGVAMKFKLFGLEQLTKVKEKWFREGLKWRLRLFINFLRVKGAAMPDAKDVKITFKRSLPANELEIAQMVTTLKDTVSDETLVGQVPFVEDVAAELERVKAQRDEAARRQKEAFDIPYEEREKTDQAEDDDE